MRNIVVLLLCVSLLACAKVSVETKEPIKVDVNMRVDIYQHVVKDVDSINDQIYGDDDMELNHFFFIQEAYAEDLSDEARAAIKRRKARRSQIEEYFVLGYAGENRNALLEVRAQLPSREQPTIKQTISDENADRAIIHKAVATKDKVDVQGVRRLFFEDDYKRALSGFLFEVLRDGKYIWVEK